MDVFASFDLRTATALWGAVTGTIAITLSIISLLRDRSRLKLVVTELDRSKVEAIREELARLSYPSYSFVEVFNVGRRVRYVYHPEIWRANDSGKLSPDFPDSVFLAGQWRDEMGAWETWRLEEGQSVTFVFGNRKKERVVRIDLADSLARRRHWYPILGRARWYWGRWKGGKEWKELRDTYVPRQRSRHHDED